MSISAILKSHLESTGISQRQFARDAGLPKTTIADIVSGKASIISIPTAEKLAPILNRSVAELMGIPDAGQGGDSGGRGAGELLIPWGEIGPSPLNPRRDFEPEALRGLADSLFEHGQLQNIVLRKVIFPQENEPKYHIVAGERRWRATGLNIQVLKRWDASQPMRAVIIETNDAQHRALALLENLQREALSPMEEAEAFHALTELAWSTAQIAEKISKTQRFVQQRLALVTKLAEPVKQALSEGVINIDQARALTSADEKRQKTLLKKIQTNNYGVRTGDEIRQRLTANLIPAEKAKFPRDRYTGEIHEDDTGREYFVDGEEFKKLQKDAAKDLVAEKRAEGWKWVELKEYWHRGEYEPLPSTDKKKAGVLVILDWQNNIEVHEGLVKKRAEKSSKADEAARQQEFAERERRRDELGEMTPRIRAAIEKDPTFSLRVLLWHSADFETPRLSWKQLCNMGQKALLAQAAKCAAHSLHLNTYSDLEPWEAAAFDLAGIERPDYLTVNGDSEDEEVEDEIETGEAEEDGD
ncbi:ParB/RepB/Spo0J family partition protein [Dongia soli]|uniref:ParB/RepB/Spo0J family partition protein n=1 Tax=Dongia soli TaxID=600628 RepID=A0ABU5E929_9PROT|nr:ParB/RepB/Spo0J family partition protein [Dongia soli]MDY0882279.1 ParB/RepB/Spo0J family partition protein [Dongia soli]